MSTGWWILESDNVAMDIAMRVICGALAAEIFHSLRKLEVFIKMHNGAYRERNDDEIWVGC